MDIVSLFPSLAPYAGVIAAVVGLCSAIAAAMPPPTPDATGAYPMAYRVVNFVALNFGHAKNATAPAPEKTP